MCDLEIYGKYADTLKETAQKLESAILAYNSEYEAETGEKLFEHVNCRIKSSSSMREKLKKQGFPETSESALTNVFDAIGLRIVCCFIDDIYENIKKIKEIPGVTVVREKDYLTNAKPNGYRSYHLILSVETNGDPVYAEIQLRTIAMDSWAALEHQMKYKKEIADQTLIVNELKRCADELAACDISMQTIRDMIRQS